MKLKALIVDDEYSGRISLQILLKDQFPKLFDKIISASSLNEAIKLISKESFQICFLDIELHDRSGFDLLPHFSSETKVIFVTAYSESTKRKMLVESNYSLKELTDLG